MIDLYNLKNKDLRSRVEFKSNYKYFKLKRKLRYTTLKNHDSCSDTNKNCFSNSISPLSEYGSLLEGSFLHYVDYNKNTRYHFISCNGYECYYRLNKITFNIHDG